MIHKTLVRTVWISVFAVCLAVENFAAAADQMQIEVTEAQVGYVRQTGEPLISFRMSEVSKGEFGKLSARNVGRKAEFRLDGRLLTAPIIREPITGGSGQISNPDFDVEQYQRIADRLTSGKAKLDVVFTEP